MWEPVCLLCGFGRMLRQEEWLAHMAGHDAQRTADANIAHAIDSNRGNEKEIARAILRHDREK